MSAQLTERIKQAIEGGNVAELEKLLASDWCAQWTATRAKDLFDEIRNGGTLTPASALQHSLLCALSIANQLYLAKAECSALRKRVEELEAREDGLSYRGTWKRGVEYRRGDFATDAGSLWHCWTPTTDRPGTSGAWQLAAKRGADGRDAR